MTFLEFREAVLNFAGGRYSAVQLDVTTYASGKLGVTWKAYVDGDSWHEGTTAEKALASLHGARDPELTEHDVAAVAAGVPEGF